MSHSEREEKQVLRHSTGKRNNSYHNEVSVLTGVPCGPLKDLYRDLLQLQNIPMTDFSPGGAACRDRDH